MYNSAVSKVLRITDYIYIKDIIIANGICLYAEYPTGEAFDDALSLYRAKEFRLMKCNIVIDVLAQIKRTSNLLIEHINDSCHKSIRLPNK